MAWNLFKQKTPGSLPLLSWNGNPFPFQASAGHNYDQWFSPYPAQTNQYYSYVQNWTGNQLPNWSVYVPVLRTQEQINRPWVTSWNPQYQNAMQTGASGGSTLMWGQQQTADWISTMGQFWGEQARGLGGGGRFGRRR